MEEPRFKPPFDSRFAIGSNDDGDGPVFEIWVDSTGGNVVCLGPNGKPGPMGRGSVRVSEDEFWVRVESGEYVESRRPYVNSLDRVRRTADLQKWAVEKLVYGMHLNAPADFERGLRELKGTMSATYGVSNRCEADAVIDALLQQFGLERHDGERVIVTPHIDSPLPFQNGYRDDRWDLRMAEGVWSEVLLVTPEILKAKNDVGDVADEMECTVAKLKFQGALSRRLEDIRDEANTQASIAYRKAWEADSQTWYGAGATAARNDVPQ